MYIRIVLLSSYRDQMQLTYMILASHHETDERPASQRALQGAVDLVRCAG